MHGRGGSTRQKTQSIEPRQSMPLAREDMSMPLMRENLSMALLREEEAREDLDESLYSQVHDWARS